VIERPARRISATAKFYVGFWLALAIVLALAFFIGYRAGIAHAERVTARVHDAP
jgi:hypothetical protein